MNPELFIRVGIKPPEGVLLYGPLRNGKNLLARAIAKNINANFLKGVMQCPECKDKLQIRISADDHIVHIMKDPSIAAFWLLTMPEVVGGFKYDDEVKQKIWWQYKDSIRYDHLRDVVAKRKPGWEYLQEAAKFISGEKGETLNLEEDTL